MSRQTCCCCFGLHSGVLAIGILNLAGSIFMIITGIMSLFSAGTTSLEEASKTSYMMVDKIVLNSIVNLIIGFIWLFCCALLIYGNRNRRHNLYLPFIVIMVIVLIWTVIRIVLIVIASIMLLTESGEDTDDREELTSHVAAIIIGIIFSMIVLGCNAYFTHVVISGRKLLIHEESDSRVAYSQNIEGLDADNSHISIVNKI